MSDDLTAEGSKIFLLEQYENRFWTEHLGITREEVLRAVAKVGHSNESSKEADPAARQGMLVRKHAGISSRSKY
jgi:hypothetical protein